MPIALIKYWREIAIIALFVAAGAFFGFWRYEVVNHKKTSVQLKTAQETINTHVANIQLVEETNNAYQNDIDRLNADVRRLRKRPARCVPITVAPDIHIEEGQGGEHGSKNGISSGWLYDYAIEAEELRIERNNCKDFVNKVWESQN